MATKSIAWTTGTGNITLTYTGQGNGTIQVASDPNNLGSARSQVITVKTTQGGVVTKNITVNQAACPFPVGDVKSYSYTGSVQSVLLPAGTYKLQCWGAQGGSNAAASSYSITAKAGGKGGYSEGVLTLSSPTTVYVFVGGQGSSSGNGGWNGGGGGGGSTSNSSGDEVGISRMGCGGGATDIALTTSSMTYSSYRNNRSAASLLSRMIVAGGGSGGAMCYKAVTTYTTEYTNLICTLTMKYYSSSGSGYIHCPNGNGSYDMWQHLSPNTTYKVVATSSYNVGAYFTHRTSVGGYLGDNTVGSDEMVTISSKKSNEAYLQFTIYNSTQLSDFTVRIYGAQQVPHTTTSNSSQVGYVGGGTSGGGKSDTYKGGQNAAGYLGEFGKGANHQSSSYRYTAGAGGGGWYGGGTDASLNGSIDTVKNSGGGSGFVNTAESEGNRPTGYTGLQLDSGTTYDGASSFPNTAGTGNETGHSGNGYAKITRLS